MAELDLSDPRDLCELLRVTLPGFEDESPHRVAPQVEALEKSDNDLFAGVGTAGRGAPDDAPVEAPQAPPAPQQGGEAQAPGLAEGEAPPLDMGGEGELLDPSQSVTQGGAELGGVPMIHARRGWTEVDRQRSKGQHEVYNLQASHDRRKPVRSKFTGGCQAVRVSLPLRRPPADGFIGTWIGTVEARDHEVFSVEEVADAYARVCGDRPRLARVDLITGARFRGRRFSPISIYLGYPETGSDARPTIYLLEGGSASGKPEALYVARSIDAEIRTQAEFAFTPFACKHNWYDGGLAMSEDKREPACVYLTVTQTRDGRHEYMRLSVTYDRDRELRKVIHPFEVQIEAALRVMAIADEAGCQLRAGVGGGLQHGLGPMVRALMKWDERPNGSATPQEREQFCGCPEA